METIPAIYIYQNIKEEFKSNLIRFFHHNFFRLKDGNQPDMFLGTICKFKYCDNDYYVRLIFDKTQGDITICTICNLSNIDKTIALTNEIELKSLLQNEIINIYQNLI